MDVSVVMCLVICVDTGVDASVMHLQCVSVTMYVFYYIHVY